MIGVFAAMDAMLFYVFFEAMLIPMFILIGVWGGPRRVYASLKFFLYTFLGSVFMLVGLVYLYLKSRSEEHTSELQSLMRISYAVFCLKKKKQCTNQTRHQRIIRTNSKHKNEIIRITAL